MTALPSLGAPSSSIDLPPSASWAWNGLVQPWCWSPARAWRAPMSPRSLTSSKDELWLKLHAKEHPRRARAQHLG